MMMTARIDIGTVLTVSQAARLLKITPAAIYKAIKRRRIPYLQIGRIFLIERAHLISYKKDKSLGGRPKKRKKEIG
jgi:excisionase family DNA binding protein